MQTDVVLPVPADAAARTQLLDRLSRLADLDHSCLEPVGAARTSADGALTVPRGTGTATDLPTVLAVRGRCTAAEAAAVAANVCRALAVLHSGGLVHGPVDASDVVVTLEGSPRLRPRLEVPTRQDEESDDVHAVACTVDGLLGSSDDDATVALRAVLAPALAGDPRIRPEAGTLAARVHDAVPPEPVRLPDPGALAAAALGRSRVDGSGPARPRAEGPADVGHRRARRGNASGAHLPRRRGDRRRDRPVRRRRPLRGVGALRIGVGAVAVVVAGGLLVVGGLSLTGTEGAASAGETGVTRAAAPSATVAVDAVDDRADPAGAAAELTRRRVQALVGQRPVDDVALVGSPAYEATAERAAEVVAADVRLLGADATVLEVSPTKASDGVAEVTVEYVVDAHERQDGGTTTEVAQGRRQSDTLRLVWTKDGWRVTDVA